MNKGHIYFEIQADDTKRAIDFYSGVFGMEVFRGQGASPSVLDDRNRRVERWSAEASCSSPSSRFRNERFRMLTRG